jgi:hypothetical protein
VNKGKEQSKVPEFDSQLVEAYAQTFVSRRDCYALQLNDGKYVCIKEPLTLDLLLAHVRGDLTLGVYVLDINSFAHWLCLDGDYEEDFSRLKQLADDLKAQGVPSYLELSRRGGHLWLFTAPLSGAEIRYLGRQLLLPYSLSRIELYPKQNYLTSGPGSLVRLPLGIHRKSGKRYPFITLDNTPLAPTIRQQMALLAHPVRVPQSFIEQTILQAQEVSPPPSKPGFEKAKWASGNTLSERLKNAISVHDFVSRYVTLDERGKGLCPFHEDYHPSFQVNRERNYWSCYAGCGGGSLIDFWMKWRAIHGQDNSFTTTVKELSEMLLTP